MYRQTLRSNRDVAGEAREMAERAEDLSPTDERVRAAVVAQNAPVNFDPEHPATVFEVVAGGGVIGSQRSNYAALLDVDVEEIAELEREWIVEGRS